MDAIHPKALEFRRQQRRAAMMGLAASDRTGRRDDRGSGPSVPGSSHRFPDWFRNEGGILVRGAYDPGYRRSEGGQVALIEDDLGNRAVIQRGTLGKHHMDAVPLLVEVGTSDGILKVGGADLYDPSLEGVTADMARSLREGTPDRGEKSIGLILGNDYRSYQVGPRDSVFAQEVLRVNENPEFDLLVDEQAANAHFRLMDWFRGVADGAQPETSAPLMQEEEFAALKRKQGLTVVAITGYSGFDMHPGSLVRDELPDEVRARAALKDQLLAKKAELGDGLMVSIIGLSQGVDGLTRDICAELGIPVMAVITDDQVKYFGADSPEGLTYLVTTPTSGAHHDAVFARIADELVILGGRSNAGKASAAASQEKKVIVLRGFGGDADTLSAEQLGPSAHFVSPS